MTYIKRRVKQIVLSKYIFEEEMKVMQRETTLLYRPVNQAELDLIKESGCKKFPPRLPAQPIFYPVMNEAYAIQMAKEWNVPAYGVGYVTCFAVDSEYLKKFKVENVGGDIHNELWVSAGELEMFNNHIIGQIAVTKVFRNKSKSLNN